MMVQGMFLGAQEMGHAQRSVDRIQAQRLVFQMQDQRLVGQMQGSLRGWWVRCGSEVGESDAGSEVGESEDRLDELQWIAVSDDTLKAIGLEQNSVVHFESL